MKLMNYNNYNTIKNILKPTYNQLYYVFVLVLFNQCKIIIFLSTNLFFENYSDKLYFIYALSVLKLIIKM